MNTRRSSTTYQTSRASLRSKASSYRQANSGKRDLGSRPRPALAGDPDERSGDHDQDRTADYRRSDDDGNGKTHVIASSTSDTPPRTGGFRRRSPKGGRAGRSVFWKARSRAAKGRDFGRDARRVPSRAAPRAKTRKLHVARAAHLSSVTASQKELRPEKVDNAC